MAFSPTCSFLLICCLECSTNPKLYISAVFQLPNGCQTPQFLSLGWQQVPPGDVLLELLVLWAEKWPFFPLVLQNGAAGPLNVSWAGLEQSLGASSPGAGFFYNFSSGKSWNLPLGGGAVISLSSPRCDFGWTLANCWLVNCCSFLVLTENLLLQSCQSWKTLVKLHSHWDHIPVKHVKLKDF